MSIRIDRGVTQTRSEETFAKKTEIKTQLRRFDSPTEYAAIVTNRNDVQNRGAAVRLKLNNLLPAATPTAPVAPTLTPETAAQKADEIIKTNGGRDDLNTDAAGRELAAVARQNPADAELIATALLDSERLREEDRDEVAQSFVQDLSDDDLTKLAETQIGRGLLKEVDENLHQYPVHNDESADSDRIRAELDKHGIFLGSPKGQNFEAVTPVSISDDPNASPEEVAAYVKNHPESSYERNTGRYAYLDALQAHENDAQWLAQFHSALGSDLAGEMISNTLDPTYHQLPGGGGTDPELPLRQVEVVRNALETMVASGDLTQEGMNALIGGMRQNPYVATELFANGSDRLKTMFINSAVNDGANSWDAGALHVLNTMSSYRQEQVLNGLGDKLNPFIEGAMAGQQEIFSFTDTVEFGWMGTSVNEDMLTKVNYGDVTKLLETANKTEVYYHARTTAPAFSQELQQKIFNAVSQGLTNSEAFENFKENTKFEDRLSSLFIRNRDELLLNAQKLPNGANSGVISDSFERGLEKFFELSLLTPPNGEQYQNLSASVFQFINDGVTALSDPSLANRDQGAFNAFVNKFGMEPTQYAQMLGGVLGSVMDATGFAQESINSDNAQKEETIKFFTGLAFAMIPGAGGKIAGAVGNEVFKHFVEEGAGYFQNQVQDNIQESIEQLLGDRFEGADNDRARELNGLLLSIFDAGLRMLPNGSSIGGNANEEQFDFQGFFQRGFDNTSQFTRFDDAIND